MQNSELQTSILRNIEIDSDIIKKLFAEEDKDSFNIALRLIKLHGADKAKLGKAWGDYLGFAYVDPNNSILNPEYIQKMGARFIIDNRALPLYKFGKAVTVATSNPTNPFIQDKVEKKLGEIVSFVFCFPFDIETCLLKNNIS